MSELTNYIKERIETLQSDSWENSWIEWKEERIAELQAVLSKIEELSLQELNK